MKNKETLEEAAVKWIRQPKLISEKESFIAGAKWQAEKMYSEENMRKSFCAGFASNVVSSINGAFEKWFENIKKK